VNAPYEIGRASGRAFREALRDQLQRILDDDAEARGIPRVRLAAITEGAPGGAARRGYGGRGGAAVPGVRTHGAPSGPDREPSYPSEPERERGAKPPPREFTPEPGERGPPTEQFEPPLPKERPEPPAEQQPDVPLPQARPEQPPQPEQPERPAEPEVPLPRPRQEPPRIDPPEPGEEPIVGAASTYDPTRPGWREGGMGTASGERYDPEATAAIQTSLRDRFGGVRSGKPSGYAIVEDGTGKRIIAKINDVGTLTPGRIIDLSRASMREFDPSLKRGVIPGVKVTPLPYGADYPTGPVGRELSALTMGALQKRLGTGGAQEAANVVRGVPPGDYVKESQARATRNLPISPELKNILEYAGRKAGIRPEVFSGQEAAGGHRTGSHRHDVGPGKLGAADVYLRDAKTGLPLDSNRPEDRKRIAKFLEEAARAGATGMGHGPGYMKPNATSKAHIWRRSGQGNDLAQRRVGSAGLPPGAGHADGSKTVGR